MSNSFGKSGNLHRQRRAGPEAHGTSQTFGGDGGGGSGGHSDSRVASNQKGQRTEESDQATTTRGGGGGGGGRVFESSGSAGQSKGAIAAQRASLPERPAEFGLSADPTRSSSGKSSSNESVVDASPSLQHEQQQQRPSSAAARRPTSGGSGGGFTTSNTQRLSSIEILNENRQRQLQLEQQESFLQHLEQRQRFIQQQQQAQQLLTADELDCAAYQVETSAPEYARMAAAAAAKAAAPTSAASRKSASASGRAPVNPFDEEPPYPAVEPREPATVSGRSGFLTALMGEGVAAAENGDANPLAHQPANKQQQQQQQQQQQVLAASARRAESFDSADHETRYSKVVQAGACSYNYDGSNDDARPFYRKDIGTLLSECRGSRKLVILIVAVALLLDNMLLTAVVPIIPAYLYKLRVVREHRNLLAAGNGTTAPSSSSAGRFSTLDANQDGRVDEAELEAELDRRINESLSSAQDRFSGSFFHPRVLKPRDKFGNPMGSAGESLDDDNGREDGADRDAGPGPESRRRGTDSEADDDRGDSGWEDEARGARKGRKRMRYPRAETSSSSSAGGRSSKLAANLDDDDEYEASDDGDKANGAGSAPIHDSRVPLNGEPDREEASAGAPAPLAAAKQVIRSAATSTRASINANTKAGDGKLSRAIAPGKTDGGGGGGGGGGKGTKGEERDIQDNDDGRDDDDEEAPASRRWNRLRSSLLEMAEQSGNDTDALGGMCLSLVLDRPNYFNRRDRSQDPDGGQPGLLAPPLKPPAPPLRSRPGSKAAARQDRDENENANEGPKGEQGPDTRRRGQKQARAGAGDQAGRRGAARARVERVRPPQTSKFAAEDRRKGAESGSTTAQPDETSKRPLAADDDGELIINHQDIVDESFEVGVMFASKPIVQAIANPFVGAITNRVGFTLPMFLGFTIMFLSTLVFAFGETYSTLFLARAIQGVGSACTSVAGMSMIADRFPDDAERGNAMAVALGGLALGVVIGPPFGGFMFEFFGKPSPFIVLAILALLDGLLQLLVLQPRISKCQDEGASLLTLIKDPYILVAAGAITFANTGIGILEPALPLWMMDTMQARNWEQGVAFLPAALSYLFSTNLFGNLGLRIGRWRSAMLGLVIIGCALLLIPFASRVDHLILPNGAIGFAIGMVDSTMMPMLGYLVDIRHTSVYGSVYAIGDVAFCASFVFGPALSGTLVELIGFEGLIVTTALICFAFAPLLVLLRDPPARQLNEAQLQEQSTLRYVNYNHLDSLDEEAHLPKGAKADAKS